MDPDLGRMRILDAKPVNLDGFSVTNPDLGLVAMRSPHDPAPSLVIRDGTVVELDGRATEDFDVIDMIRTVPATQRIPILVITAKSLTSAERNELEGNVQGILSKTEFRRSDFIEHVVRVAASVDKV